MPPAEAQHIKNYATKRAQTVKRAAELVGLAGRVRDDGSRCRVASRGVARAKVPQTEAPSEECAAPRSAFLRFHPSKLSLNSGFKLPISTAAF